MVHLELETLLPVCDFLYVFVSQWNDDAVVSRVPGGRATLLADISLKRLVTHHLLKSWRFEPDEATGRLCLVNGILQPHCTFDVD